MYSLDIETLISALKNSRIEGLLKADLASGGISGYSKGSVVVTLKDGNLVSAVMYDPKGRALLQGQDALNKIRHVVLHWELAATPVTQQASNVLRWEPTVPLQPRQHYEQSPSLRTTNPSMPMFPTPHSGQLPALPTPHSGQFPSYTTPNTSISGASYVTGPQRAIPPIGSLVPIRYQRLSIEQMHYLSRNGRNIYMLVNGANSVQRIAELLNLPLELVYSELVSLQRNQFIAFTERR